MLPTGVVPTSNEQMCASAATGTGYRRGTVSHSGARSTVVYDVLWCFEDPLGSTPRLQTSAFILSPRDAPRVSLVPCARWIAPTAVRAPGLASQAPIWVANGGFLQKRATPNPPKLDHFGKPMVTCDTPILRNLQMLPGIECSQGSLSPSPHQKRNGLQQQQASKPKGSKPLKMPNFKALIWNRLYTGSPSCSCTWILPGLQGLESLKPYLQIKWQALWCTRPTCSKDMCFQCMSVVFCYRSNAPLLGNAKAACVDCMMFLLWREMCNDAAQFEIVETVAKNSLDSAKCAESASSHCW